MNLLRQSSLSFFSPSHIHPFFTLTLSVAVPVCSFKAATELGEKALQFSIQYNLLPGALATVYYNFAMSLLKLGETLTAIQYFERANGLAPGRSKITSALGCAYHMNGQFEKAVGAYQQVINLDRLLTPFVSSS